MDRPADCHISVTMNGGVHGCDGTSAVKNGTPSTHPIQVDELRALRRLQRESPASPFVFVSERGSPFTTACFALVLATGSGALMAIAAVLLGSVRSVRQ
jgi:hypothetical protein